MEALGTTNGGKPATLTAQLRCSTDARIATGIKISNHHCEGLDSCLGDNTSQTATIHIAIIASERSDNWGQ